MMIIIIIIIIKCCTCLHLSSAPFLSASACSARSIAFSLSSFSICIFFLIASMVPQVRSTRRVIQRQRQVWGQVGPGARVGVLGVNGSRRVREWCRPVAVRDPDVFRRARWPYLGSWRTVGTGVRFIHFTTLARTKTLHLVTSTEQTSHPK